MSGKKTKQSETNEMKTTRICFGILALAMIFMAMPVSADAGTVAIKASITPVFSMTMDTTLINFPMTIVGDNLLTSADMININSNAPFAVTARDAVSTPNIAAGAPAGSSGHLLIFNGVDHYYGMLANPLQVSLNGAYTSLSGTDQTIHSSSTGAAFSAPIKLKQTTTYADSVVNLPNYYTMSVTFTGAAS
jgi:hypothetical protein